MANHTKNILNKSRYVAGVNFNDLPEWEKMRIVRKTRKRKRFGKKHRSTR